MLKILKHNTLEQLVPVMDEMVFERIIPGQINRFESYEGVNLISFDWLDIHNMSAPPELITIYHTKEDLFFICEGGVSYRLVSQLVTEDASNEKMLYTFFNGLIKEDIAYIETLEESITNTEDELLTTSKKECAQEIIEFRRALLKLKRYYEQLNQIFEELVENERGLIDKTYLRYFKALDNRIDRLFAHVLTLRDYVTQVREAYQAQIDIEQNSLMKVFTVVTAIFLPLTLIVGWYGMNFSMPEYSWSCGYLLVIGLSVVVLLFSVIFFKYKRWF
ncbi:MAG TPA: CorA family divalent cation transporter [Clostridia bacterium]|nr:CorA family divalent cation transporter [Clostridia bacterium]